MNIMLSGMMNKSSSSYIIRDLISILSNDHNIILKATSDIVCCDDEEKLFFTDLLIKQNNDIDYHINISDASYNLNLKADKNVIYLFNDYPKLTELQLKVIQNYDEIWLPSLWSFHMLSKQGIKNIHYVPFGIDTHEIQKVKSVQTSDTVKFFTLCNWDERKNLDIIIQSFCKAFYNTDDVSLNLYFKNPTLKDEYQVQWLALNNHKLANKEYRYKDIPATLAIISEYFHTKEQYYNSLNVFDVGVFPFRSDCLALPMREMMALKKPCVAISNSAFSDLITKENSYTINEFNMLPILDERNKLNGTVGEWADIKISQLSNQLRMIYEEINTDKQNKIKEQACKDAFKISLNLTKKEILRLLS